MRTCVSVAVALVGLAASGFAAAADPVPSTGAMALGALSGPQMAGPLRMVLLLTFLSLLPVLLIAVTSFTRFIIVLSMLRHAIGMPETPPNIVLISLALFLTMFTMAPVWERVNADAIAPYLEGKTSEQQAFDAASAPMKTFMLRQVREKDVALVFELGRKQAPADENDIELAQLIPAFMLSELRRAFEIGFIVFLPFVLIDLIVSSVLMSLGMIMVPPQTLALPLKVLLFVLIDGWSLLAASLVKSFNPI